MLEFIFFMGRFVVPLILAILYMFLLGIVHLKQEERFSYRVVFLCIVFPPSSWYFLGVRLSRLLFNKEDKKIHRVFSLSMVLFLFVMQSGLAGVGVYSQSARLWLVVYVFTLPVVILVKKIWPKARVETRGSH